MKNKINIAELLKDCPKGMELDCTLFNNPVTLEEVVIGIDFRYPIVIKLKSDDLMMLTEYGCYNHVEDAKCVIFPKGKTTWEGFVLPCKFKPPCKFKDGDIITNSLGTCIFKGEGKIKGTVDYYCGISSDYFNVKDNKCSPDEHYGNIVDYRLATEEEKARLFQAIKDNGYKWNAETKTLEKLVEPKFHEGDWVVTSYGEVNQVITVSEDGEGFTLDDDSYFSGSWKDMYHLWTIEDAKDGDVLFHSDSASNGIFIFKKILQHGTIQKVTCYCDYDSEDGFCLGENHTCCWTDSKILHPATKEQCTLLFRMMKKAGYEWNEKTKTLEKFPKFKVGDIIQNTETKKRRTITKIHQNCYECDDRYALAFENQDYWELAPNKFDIFTLKPYDKVLVRDCNTDKWNIDFFSYYGARGGDDYQCMTFTKNQCIPYEANEHLLGTTNDCDEYFKTWGIMESVIKWKTGFPTKKGRYILSIKGGKIDMDNWSIYTKNWYHYNNNYVIAWCKLSDIEPYKE